jgi:hypothetical protein
MVRQPLQSHPVSAEWAGELTPASPIVMAAAATTIAALRRKVIKVSLWLVPPSERPVLSKGHDAVSPALGQLNAMHKIATLRRAR